MHTNVKSFVYWYIILTSMCYDSFPMYSNNKHYNECKMNGERIDQYIFTSKKHSKLINHDMAEWDDA